MMLRNDTPSGPVPSTTARDRALSPMPPLSLLIDQGSTIEEAINNLREATKLYLEECPDVEAIPRLVTTMEICYGELVYA